MRIKSIFTHSAQAIAEGALISLLVVGLIAGTAFAAKPAASTGGHKGGGGTGGTATLVVSPNPAAAYSEFKITGCGYKPNVGIKFVLYAADVTAVQGGQTDAGGCILNAVGWANAPGTARLEAWVNSVTLTATASFTIQ
jgi:hypothetical protein